MNTVLSAFGEQLSSVPEALALVQAEHELSYAQLAHQSLYFAHQLQNLGLLSGQTVALACSRSNSAIAAMLGTLLCGCAFVPIDQNLPDQRIAFMLKDASVACVIADQTLGERIKRLNSGQELPQLLLPILKNVLGVSTDEINHAALVNSWYAKQPEENSIAYVMYTSGSTGTPKGVPISHRALACYCAADVQAYKLHKSDRTLQFSTLSFDICIEEIFPPLTIGSTVVLRPSERSDHQIELSALIEQFNITAVHLATGYWHEWVDLMCASDAFLPDCLRLMVVTGEKVSVEHYQRWLTRARAPVLWANAYGPTEATVSATVFIPPKDWQGSALPIGKALPGYTTYILNANNETVPQGETGELCIGGPALATGYLNRPQQTEKAFIPNPFSDSTGSRLYRTGDLAYALPSGDIHYAGRLDHQIKLGSYRIEPGEIENAINGYPDVTESLVVAQMRKNTSVLVAYIATTNASQTTQAMTQHLRELIPSYMLPNNYVFLKKLPKTLNGKIDRDALPTPNAAPNLAQPQSELPTTPAQITLHAIWQDVLGNDAIGINDNFFALGGDSLIAVRAIARIRQDLNFTISTRDFFFMDTVALQAAHIAGQEVKPKSTIRQVGFINSKNRQIYTVLTSPDKNQDNGRGILLVAPLGNEQRRVQRPFRNLMRQWSQQGFSVLRFDWRGTGNSSGFAESELSPDVWIEDLRDAAQHLSNEVNAIDVISVRLGSLLVEHASLNIPSIENLVYWDPVIDGNQWLNEMRQLQTGILADTYRYLFARKQQNTPASVEELNEIQLHRDMTDALSRMSLFNANNPAHHLPNASKIKILLPEQNRAAIAQFEKAFPLADIASIDDKNDWNNPRQTTTDMVVNDAIKCLSQSIFKPLPVSA